LTVNPAVFRPLCAGAHAREGFRTNLAEAVKQPIEGGFIKIETEEDPKQIELDAAQVAAEAPNLQENYGISALHRLD
jgi:hypothetical protein